MKSFPNCLEDFGSLKGVYQETIVLDRPFETLAQSFAGDEGTVLLLSGSDSDCSEYNILALDPWLEIKTRQETVQIKSSTQIVSFKHDPFKVVESLIDRFHLQDLSTIPGSFPVCSGLFGYFSYDLKDRIEKLPQTCIDTFLPDLCLYAPSIVIVEDLKTRQCQLFIPLVCDSTGPAPDQTSELVEQKKAWFFDKIQPTVEEQSFSINNQGFKSSLSKSEYISAINKIISYLKAGDIYQANLSQRFEAGFSGDAYSLYLDLFKRNPASFFSYIHAGDHFIVSTSPERFIKQDGRHVETRPIKGTISRGQTKEIDDQKGKTLSNSIKDDAELTMIVDLMRNDLSRVTQPESVVVTEHKRLEPYDNVFHLVSVVQGELKPEKNSVDLIRATFPGGSITGCPKIRSMEIIDELEPVKRHVYTGSIGYISFHDTMDLSIAIRTATIVNKTVFFSVGGGIVYDSDPEKEFQETLDKGKTLMDALAGSSKKTDRSKIKAWADGKIIDQDQVKVAAVSSGFQYGAGLFETILVKNSIPHRLKDHLDRLKRSWKALFSAPFPDITWVDVIDQLVQANGFESKTLAVKLMISKDEQSNGKKVFLAAFAREYVHRLDMLKKEGIDLVTYPFPRQTPLADLKTMNYLYYDRAGKYARQHKGDEALILNPDQSVSETNTANIFAVKDRQVIVPESDHVLPGVTLKSVLSILSNKGFEICRKQVSKQELISYPDIILTNALMGAVKVLTIDEKSIKQKQDICSMINNALF